MRPLRILVAIALLVASLLLLSYLLFSPRTVRLVLETGQEVAAQSTNYFALSTVLVLVFCSFLAGAAVLFLYSSADPGSLGAPARVKTGGAGAEQGDSSKRIELVLPLLRDDERRALQALLGSKGELLQSELAERLALGKVKMTRVLANLERKQLVRKERHGMTNRVRLKI